MSADEKVAAEAAEQEFRRWADAMDIAWKFDADSLAAMDDKDRKDFSVQKRIVIDGIRFGRLGCNEQGEFVFTPQVGNTSPLTFHEPDGAALLAIDKVNKEFHGVTKTFAVLGAITGQPPNRFAPMKNRDLSVCQAVLGFLLGK